MDFFSSFSSNDEMGIIQFNYEEDVETLKLDEKKLNIWITKIIEREQSALQQLDFIFCTDDYLHKINVDYLQHDTYTDIITFPYQSPPIIHGDIFISIPRVRENAQLFNTSFDQELKRVIIHGVLHLCGYPDKTPEEAANMRQKEQEALSLF